MAALALGMAPDCSLEISAIRCSLLRPPGPGDTLAVNELIDFFRLLSSIVACVAPDRALVECWIGSFPFGNLDAI